MTGFCMHKLMSCPCWMLIVQRSRLGHETSVCFPFLLSLGLGVRYSCFDAG